MFDPARTAGLLNEKVAQASARGLAGLRMSGSSAWLQSVAWEDFLAFERALHAAIVSQSPSMIRQWLETVSAAGGAPPTWEAVPFPTRARALLSAEEWMRTR